MSEAQSILADLDHAGVKVEHHGDRLRLDAPVGVLNDDLLDRIKQHKTGLLALLAPHDQTRAEVSYTMKENAMMTQVSPELRRTVDMIKNAFIDTGGATVLISKTPTIKRQN